MNFHMIRWIFLVGYPFKNGFVHVSFYLYIIKRLLHKLFTRADANFAFYLFAKRGSNHLYLSDKPNSMFFFSECFALIF